jgi:sugar (pentulose or hexulose) kinase
LPSTPILCADIGTTSLKAAFIDVAAQGTLLAFARSGYPRGCDAPLWEEAFFRAVRELSGAAPHIRPEALCI